MDNHENQKKFVENENEMNEDQRVKVLSPGLLVFKRFVRNRLAIVGVTILVVMILFSFVGGIVVDYEEDQSFMKTETKLKEFASASETVEPKFFLMEGAEFANAYAQYELFAAINGGEKIYAVEDTTYYMNTVSEGFYDIKEITELAQLSYNAADKSFSDETNVGNASADLIKAFKKAVQDGKTELELSGKTYAVIDNDGKFMLAEQKDFAASTKKALNVFDESSKPDYEFVTNLGKALAADEKSFSANDKTFEIEESDNFTAIFADGKEYAIATDYKLAPVENGVILSLEFIEGISDAIAQGKEEFTADDITYEVERKNTEYKIKSAQTIKVLDIYAHPSSKHWLGTNKDGMDNLTRLMYGGRISLLIGVVVVFIEILIGIVLGGLAGYFGKWVDNLIMRLVDVIICIPSMPIYIILGSIMDANRVDARIRIYYLMFVLGILSWPGIARMVRGQILSLREQEYMIATEATGISVKRRIFKHLIPNVIPQLIVIATMDLGSLILTEATLSFLGLGVKFPYASWGNIITAVNSSYVMTHYWFAWIPAGFLILLTVLGFNFVGDGLRDAFDPKMKR